MGNQQTTEQEEIEESKTYNSVHSRELMITIATTQCFLMGIRTKVFHFENMIYLLCGMIIFKGIKYAYVILQCNYHPRIV